MIILFTLKNIHLVIINNKIKYYIYINYCDLKN